MQERLSGNQFKPKSLNIGYFGQEDLSLVSPQFELVDVNSEKKTLKNELKKHQVSRAPFKDQKKPVKGVP